MYKLAIHIYADDDCPVHGMVVAFVCGVIDAPMRHSPTNVYTHSVTVLKLIDSKEQLKEIKRVLRRLRRVPEIDYTVDVFKTTGKTGVGLAGEDLKWKGVEVWFEDTLYVGNHLNRLNRRRFGLV